GPGRGSDKLRGRGRHLGPSNSHTCLVCPGLSWPKRLASEPGRREAERRCYTRVSTQLRHRAFPPAKWRWEICRPLQSSQARHIRGGMLAWAACLGYGGWVLGGVSKSVSISDLPLLGD